MLLLFQVSCVLGVITQTAMAADDFKTNFNPYDESFLFAKKKGDNRAEVATTLGPSNSAEVYGTTQLNSAEVESDLATINPFSSPEVRPKPTKTAQENSDEVQPDPATINPFSSPEVTPKPCKTKNPSIDNSQKVVDPNANSETVEPNTNQETNNNVAVTSSVAGTQPFYPQPQEVTGSKPAQPDNTVIVGTAAGTQPFYPLTINVGSEKGTGKKPIRPVNVAGANRVPGVEPISPFADSNLKTTDQVHETISQQKPVGAINIPGVEPIKQVDDVQNSLRDALSQVGVDNTVDDPLVEQAKQYFISIWNIEAHRLDAPYLEVTDVWPEIGMVYMPTINQMSSKIQNSRPVKEAAERLKTIWEERKPIAEASTDDGHVLSVLTDFIGSWGFGASARQEEVPLQEDINKPVKPIAIFPPKVHPISGKLRH